MMANLHVAVAIATAVLAALLLATLAVARLRGSIPRLLIDRLILAVEAAVALGIVIGLIQVATGPGPDDPLHLVYAAIALVALPIGRAWRGMTRGPRLLPLGLATVIVLGVLVRLAQTG